MISPSIIASNVDYLQCSLTVALPESHGTYLYELLAASQGEPVESVWSFCDEPLTAAFSPSGLPYLHNDLLDLRFRAGPGDTTAMVTLYSRAFWMDGGAEMAVARLQRWCDEFYGDHVPLKPGRLDLCRDLTGFPVPQFSTADLARSIVTRGRKLQSIASDGEHGEVQTWRIGSRKAACHARIYNKTAELAHSLKDYYHPTWQGNGYAGLQEHGPVTRVEYELHTAFWREWRTDDQRRIDTAQELLCELNAIWRYLTCEWLRFVVLDPAEDHRERLATLPAWSLVASRFDARAAITGGNRYERRLPQVEACLQQIAGLARSIAAVTQNGEAWTPRDFIRTLGGGVARYVARKGSAWDDLVLSRRARIFAGIAV